MLVRELTVIVGLVTSQQTMERTKEYLDELAFGRYCRAEVVKRFCSKFSYSRQSHLFRFGEMRS